MIEMALLCPACRAVLPQAKEGSTEQICSICGSNGSEYVGSIADSEDSDESFSSFAAEAARESAEIVSRFQSRIPPHLLSILRDFHFQLGVHSFPLPTSKQVLRIAQLLFPECSGSIVGMLDRFGAKDDDGRERVQLAVLKLVGSDSSRIEKYVEEANADIREVIMEAEAPRATAILMSQGFSALQALTQTEKVNLAESDLLQYLEWLDSVLSSDGRS